MSDNERISALIRLGGAYYNVGGDCPDAAFTDLVSQIVLPEAIDPTALLAGLKDRERIMTTSVGHGIALPHPRVPMVSRPEDERVYVCYLDKAVNFDAMDGNPVYVLFVILSSGSQSHLGILSRLSWLFQREDFRGILRKKPDSDELANVIEQFYSKESKT